VDFKDKEGKRPLGKVRGKFMYDMMVFVRDKVTSKRGKEGQDVDGVFKGAREKQYLFAYKYSTIFDKLSFALL